MDILFLRQLEVSAIIGIHPQEKIIPQPLWIDIEMQVNVFHAAAKDEISSTVDYSSVYNYLHEYIGATRFNLIETLAHQLSENLIKNFSLNWLRLTIVKKPADMPGLGGAGITIEKSLKTLLP